MSTVGATLQLFDSFSQTMNRAEQSIQSTLNVAEKLKQSLQTPNKLNIDTGALSQLERLPEAIETGFRNVQRVLLMILRTARELRVPSNGADQLQGALSRVADQEKQIVALQDKVNSKIRQGANETDGFLSKIKGLAAAYLGFETAKRLGELTFGGAGEQAKMEDMFKARTGDDQLGAAMFQKFKKDALKAGMDVNEAMKGTLSFFSTTQDVETLTKLNNLTQRLNAFDSAGNGIEGAAFALKEAMSGDIVSLAERFNMSKTDIRAFKIDDLGKAGDMKGFTAAFDKLLEKQKMGQAAFEKMLASPAKQAEILGNNLKSTMADAGQGAMAALLPLITLTNKMFQEGKFQPFFDGLATALRVVTMLFTALANTALWIWNVIQANWPLISAILIGVAAAITAALIPSIWAMVTSLWAAIEPLLVQAAIWATMNWPILLLGAMVAFLAYQFIQMGVTADQVVGVIAGAFMVLVGAIYNQVAFMWNIFASFAEFLGNLFIDPSYAIKKLIYDLAKTFGGHVQNMLRSAEEFAGGFMKTILDAVNGVLKGFDWLSAKIKDLTGVDLGKVELFDTNNVHAMSDRIKELMDQMVEPTTDKDVFHIDRMQEKNLKNEFDYGYKKGANFVNNLSFQAPGADMSNLLKNQNINRVNEVGKIKDKVEISSEDLKVMRDLAEIQSIQNFVTLTPSVHVTTGPVEGPDSVDKIVNKITAYMETEIQSSAKGVYGL
ncbi:hypothetical protein [Paenibacillus elgii]|uniref:hypothetical protein n=1 Tax=Paenibacillus elgii TaxID=189691 RepID=UPI0020416193|nr:hypothetical protein [Paenibacillus elgii]MCM3273656.1 hypothetical protein [Paenibacillus elgii]